MVFRLPSTANTIVSKKTIRSFLFLFQTAPSEKKAKKRLVITVTFFQDCRNQPTSTKILYTQPREIGTLESPG